MAVVSFIVSLWTSIKPYFSILYWRSNPVILCLCDLWSYIHSIYNVPMKSVSPLLKVLMLHSASRISWASRVFSHPFLYYLDFHYLHVYSLSCSFTKYLMENFAGRTYWLYVHLIQMLFFLVPRILCVRSHNSSHIGLPYLGAFSWSTQVLLGSSQHLVNNKCFLLPGTVNKQVFVYSGAGGISGLRTLAVLVEDWDWIPSIHV